VIYLDTSYIVKAYINEPYSDLVLEELAGQTGLTSSSLARVEFVSALMRQCHSGELTETDAKKAIASLDEDTTLGIWNWVAIDKTIITDSAAMLMDHRLKGKLRSLDAMHLTTAKTSGTGKVYTHDKRMFEAARTLGLNPIDIIPAT